MRALYCRGATRLLKEKNLLKSVKNIFLAPRQYMKYILLMMHDNAFVYRNPCFLYKVLKAKDITSLWSVTMATPSGRRKVDEGTSSEL